MVSNVSRKINIFIVDDNEDFVLEVEKSLRTIPKFEPIGKAYDGETAVHEIIDKKPDIVVLDLVMPQKDGIAVLEELQEKIPGSKPVIIILSAVGNDKYIKKALNLGAEYYILKPFDMELLPKRIMQIYSDSDMAGKPQITFCNNSINHNVAGREIKNRTLREKVEAYVIVALRDIEVPAHLSGYTYLRKAIVETVLSERGTIPITKQLYPMIAEYYDTSPGKVERAIRGAIQKVWQRASPQKLKQYFTYTDNRKAFHPTNSEFIATVADKIRLTYLL